MPKIIRAQWKLAEGVTIAQFGPGNGQLQLLLDEYPSYNYQQSGVFFYGLDGDFVNVYEFRPGTKEAFGGREIVLEMIDGTSKAFRGSLWDPWEINDENIPRICAVNITTESGVMERGHTFFSSHIKLGRYIEIRAALGAPVPLSDFR